MFSIDENMARKLVDPELNKDGTLKNSQQALPTSLSIGPNGDIYILYSNIFILCL